jgi:hypothetical protein
MRKQYLHLSAYSCDKCRGPVVSGFVAVREDEISRETAVRQLGAICLSCGNRQDKAAAPDATCYFPPVRWELREAIDATHTTTARVEALNRAELH